MRQQQQQQQQQQGMYMGQQAMQLAQHAFLPAALGAGGSMFGHAGGAYGAAAPMPNSLAW
jgi:hypothetical protein